MANDIIKPLITEKTLNLARSGWYTFKAASGADKKRIAERIAAIYKVTVKKVRTISQHGKARKVGKRQKTRYLSDWKKTLVALSSGQHIDVFEVTQEGENKKHSK